jgi:hypothetical protein
VNDWVGVAATPVTARVLRNELDEKVPPTAGSMRL